jgi:hypothetical protein
MNSVHEQLMLATKLMQFPNVIFHLNVFDNYHGGLLRWGCGACGACSACSARAAGAHLGRAASVVLPALRTPRALLPAASARHSSGGRLSPRSHGTCT